MILIYAECGEYSDYRFEVLGCVSPSGLGEIEAACRAGVLELLKRHSQKMHWNLVIRAPREDDPERWARFDRSLDQGESRRVLPTKYPAGTLLVIANSGIRLLDRAPDEDDWIVSWMAPERLK